MRCRPPRRWALLATALLAAALAQLPRATLAPLRAPASLLSASASAASYSPLPPSPPSPPPLTPRRRARLAAAETRCNPLSPLAPEDLPPPDVHAYYASARGRADLAAARALVGRAGAGPRNITSSARGGASGSAAGAAAASGGTDEPPDELPRSIYVTVLSLSHLPDFLANFPGQERHLLAPANAHFMLAVPAADARAVVAAVAAALGWARVMGFTAPQLEYACEARGDRAPELDGLQGWWRTPRGTTALVVARHFREPAVLRSLSAGALRAGCGPVSCCMDEQLEPFRRANATLSEEEFAGRRNFSVLTMAFVHHLVADMAVMDLYDYLFKLDADLVFAHAPPDDAARLMRERGCVFMHSMAIGADNWRNCAVATRAGMDAFAAAHGLAVQARIAEWCRDGNAYMYGNFVGGWRPFLRARGQVALLRFLYDSVPDMLALADQGATRASLCFWYDVGSLGRRWGPTGPLLCDLSSWRVALRSFSHLGEPVER